MILITVVVFYRPDQETLDFFDSYASALTPVIAVWNEFESCELEPFFDNPNVTVIKKSKNIGLAKALNLGIATAFDIGANFVLLLDQDSRPNKQMPHALLASYNRAIAAGWTVGLIGPTLRDRKVGGIVNRIQGPVEEYQAVQRLSTSGSFIEKSAFEAVGPMWDVLFIDGIDSEWCYRAQSKGLYIIQSLRIEMDHDMGDVGINLLGYYKPIHRSPMRHYHIVRNSFWLARLSHVPKAFSLSEIAKMIYRIPIYLLVSSSILDSLSAIFRGVKDGLLKKPVKPKAN